MPATVGASRRSVASVRNSIACSRCAASVAASAEAPRTATSHCEARSGICRCARSGRAPRAADFGAPAGQAGEAVGGVADQREVVGDRRRRHAELLDHAGFVAHLPRAAVELHDAVAEHALRQVLVRRADQHARDARIGGGRRPPRPPAHRRPRTPPSGTRPRPSPTAPARAGGTAPAAPGRCRRRSCSRATARCGTTR